MRNFEERKAEIFRRSGESIAKQRKCIRIVTTVCIPLICLIFISIPVMICYYPDSSAEREEVDAEVGNVNDEPISPSESPEAAESAYYVQLSTGESFSGDKAEQIAKKLDGILSSTETDVSANEEAIPESVSDVYTLEILRPDGSESIYVLEGNSLTERGGGTVTISDTELASLKEMLGLS